MSDVQESKRVLRPAQAAQKLSISVATLYRLARTNPAFPRLHKLSQRITVLDEAEIDRFVASTRAAA